ncbi:MAG: Rieske (2Fe-2S) protein [Candidatus Poribacteria bacterium]|nr:Rieske (2Fe-2S) protein [Candidatus Poribacteria bacterium]
MATQSAFHSDEFVYVGSQDQLKTEGHLVATGAGAASGIVVFYHDGEVYAVDNRCPHMGFPLNLGTIKDGILTCHWHHARFDLKSGCTFDPWADDVQSYPVEVRDGDVWLNPHTNGMNTAERWKCRLREGMEQNLNLVMAKAVIALRAQDVPSKEIVEVGATHGCKYEWQSGHVIFTAMANILDYLADHDQFLALYQGLSRVSGDTFNQPVRICLLPLETDQIEFSTLKRWSRNFAEVRNQDSVERSILTAIAMGCSDAQVADILFAAATDHFYMAGGHTLDFINKGFELLDLIGWEHASLVLPSLARQICSAERSEETNAWRHPIDLVPLLEEVFEVLPDLVTAGQGSEWDASTELTGLLLGDDPQAIVDALKDAIQSGATWAQLTQTLAYAAALRIARFHTKNEFNDWITVLHTFTYCNALHQAMKRAPSIELARGIFHGAMSLYLDRFLNMPAARLPHQRRELDTLPGNREALLDGFLPMLDKQHQVDNGGAWVYRYLSQGYSPDEIIQRLGTALLREDAEFHSFQVLEAGIQLYEELKGTAEGNLVLVAVARYLAGHAPTDRSSLQTANIALRLHRGEDLAADDVEEEAAD